MNATPSRPRAVNDRRPEAGVHPCHERNFASISSAYASMPTVVSVIARNIAAPGTRARAVTRESVLSFWAPSHGTSASTRLTGPAGTVSSYGYTLDARTMGPAAVGSGVGASVAAVVGTASGVAVSVAVGAGTALGSAVGGAVGA